MILRGRFSDKIHKSQLLIHDRESPWLTPIQIKEKDRLNGILNRILFSIKMINFILSQRDKHVNDYRKKMAAEEKLDDTWQHLILYTESYFSYVTITLNAYAELIYELGDNFPQGTDGNFSKLWEYVQNNQTSEQSLDTFFKNNMHWYELYVRLPRNQLVIHDRQTAGYGMNDHGIDVYVGKNGNYDKDKSKEALRLLSKIKNNHSEFNSLDISGNYFHPIYRQIAEKLDLLNSYEIQLLVNACGIAGFDFPYIPQVNPKLQEFLNFINQWLKDKFQLCPKCTNDYLVITHLVINPNIQKFDTNNVWFGRICPQCHYQEKFD